MPPGRTGRAAVEIIGDVSNFGATVERDLNRELRGVDVDASSVGRKIAASVDEGVRTSGIHLKKLAAQAKATMSSVGNEADRAGSRIGDGIGKGTRQGRDELGRFVKQGGAAGAGFALSFGGVSGLLGGIGKAAGAAFSLGFKGIALASTVSTAASLVAAILPAVGAVGALAPAFIASKIAGGALQLALMGVGDALTAGITGDTAAFNEALEAMPPAAQAALREVISLKDQITGVRTAVQGAFFQPLIGQLAPLGSTYLPLVTSQLSSISGGFGKAVASASGFLRMPSSVAAVNASLGSTSTAVNNVTAGLPGLIRAFLPLWEVGSGFLPGLTHGFDDLTQRVGAFMEKAQKTGQLESFISGGLSVLGQLGTLLGSVGSILTSVFQAAAAAGGDVLGVVGQALSQFAAFLNTAEGSAALTALFGTLAQAAQIMGSAMAIVLPVIGQLVGVLAGALAPILPIIASLVQQLAPVVQQVGQALGTILGPAIGVVAGLLSTLIPIIMPIVTALIGQLMPVVTALAPVISALGQVISTILGTALQALMPLFMALLPIISQLLVSVLTPLVPILGLVGELFMALMPALTPLIALAVTFLERGMIPLQIAIPIVAAVLRVLIQAIIAIVGPLASAIGWVANFLNKLLTTPAVMNAVKAAWNGLKAAASAVFSFIGSYITARWNQIKAITSSVWGFIRSYITSQVNAAKSVLNGIGAAVSAVIGFFGRMRSGAASALSSFRSAVSSAVSAVIGFFGRMVSGISGKVNSAISTVRGIGGRIRSAVGNLGSILWNAGASVIQGLISGIESKIGALQAKASAAASTIRNLFPFSPAKEGPLSGRGSPEIAGAKIATMVASGLERRIPAIRAAAIRAADEANVAGGAFTGVRDYTQKQAILAAAYGGNFRTGTIQPSLSPAGGGSMGARIHMGSGALTMSFYGNVTPQQAYNAGQSAGRGLMAAFNARDVRTTVRSI